MGRKLWDFTNARGQNIIRQWGKQQSTRDQAKLDQKFDRLQQIDFELAIGTKLLAGPINKYRHIYKMTIHGQAQLRPMLCKGPQNIEHEYTLLVGAVERDSKLTPDAGEAEGNRNVLLNAPNHRRAHERIRT